MDKILEDGEERAVNKDEVESYAQGIGAKVFETSAKTGTNVDSLFYQIAEDHSTRSDEPPECYDPVDLGASRTQKQGDCAC